MHKKNKIKKEIRNRQKKINDVSTSKSSDEDEEYNSILKQMLKRKKKKISNKTVIGVDAVLPKEVKTHKRQKLNSKKDTLSVYMEKIPNEQILKNIVCRSSFDMKKHKTKTHDKNKNVDSATINCSMISDDEEYISLLNTFVKKMKKNKKKSTKTVIKFDTVLPKGVKKIRRKKQKVNLKNGTSSVYTNKLHHDQILDNIFRTNSYSNFEAKKEKAMTYRINKNVDSATMNTSNISDDEDYKLLLNTFVKKMKTEKKKCTKTVKKVDTVLPNEVKKIKQQKVNLKKDTSSVYTNKMHHEYILESIVGTNFSDSNSDVKKEKAKTHSITKNSTTINTCSMSDDEDYTSLLNTFVKKMKKEDKKESKAETHVKLLPSKEVINRAQPTTPVTEYLTNNIADICSEKTNSNETLKCAICKNSFKSLQGLTTHNAFKHHTNLFMCTICGKSYSQICSLRLHYKTHPGDRDFECNVCGNQFAQEIDVREHYKVHVDERPFGCDVCGKRFRKRKFFYEHYKTHVGTKDHVCDVCGKRFLKKKDLPNHYITHTGEKSYECDICRKKFGYRSKLDRHYRVHTGERPYVCDICGKAFARIYNLTVHNRIHTGEKPYECGQCIMSFVSSGDLKRHTRKKHDKCL